MNMHHFFRSVSSYSIKATFLLCALAGGVVMVDIVRLSLSQISIPVYISAVVALIVAAISTGFALMTNQEAK